MKTKWLIVVAFAFLAGVSMHAQLRGASRAPAKPKVNQARLREAAAATRAAMTSPAAAQEALGFWREQDPSNSTTRQ